MSFFSILFIYNILVFVLSSIALIYYIILFIILYYYIFLDVLFLMRKRKGVDIAGQESGEELLRVGGGEAVIQIYYMRKIL